MATSKAKDISAFRALHDKNVIVPGLIKKALATVLAAGPENWEYESDLFKLAGVSQTDGAKFREQFDTHIVEAPAQHGKSARRVWFGDPKAAVKART